MRRSYSGVIHYTMYLVVNVLTTKMMRSDISDSSIHPQRCQKILQIIKKRERENAAKGASSISNLRSHIVKLTNWALKKVKINNTTMLKTSIEMIKELFTAFCDQYIKE